MLLMIDHAFLLQCYVEYIHTVSTSVCLGGWRVRWCFRKCVYHLLCPLLVSSWPLLFCDYSKGWQDPRKWDVLAPYAGGRPADHRHVGRATTTEQL